MPTTTIAPTIPDVSNERNKEKNISESKVYSSFIETTTHIPKYIHRTTRVSQSRTQISTTAAFTRRINTYEHRRNMRRTTTIATAKPKAATAAAAVTRATTTEASHKHTKTSTQSSISTEVFWRVQTAATAAVTKTTATTILPNIDASKNASYAASFTHKHMETTTDASKSTTVKNHVFEGEPIVNPLGNLDYQTDDF